MKGKRLLAGLMAALMCFGTAPAMTGIAAEGTQDSSSVVATVDSHYSVIIPKSLVMSVDTATWHGAADYQATVIGDIEMGKSVYVVPQARFDMTKEDGSAIVNTAVSQTKTEWPSADVKSAEEDAIWGDGSLSGDGFQPGDWSGVFYFNIAADDSGKTIEAPGDKVISTDLKDGDVADAGTFQLGQGQSGSIQLMMDGQDVTRLATYESDNERITVSDQGVVNTDNANGGDEATITATYYTQTAAAADGVGTNVVKAYFKVQVIGITFDKETVTARPGDTVEVTASVLPDSVDGTVKWMLNGLDFGYEGNTITINVAEDAQPGNYALVAMYGGTTQTLNIKVSAGPTASGIVDGGEYTGSVIVTVGEGNTVTVDGNSVELNSENRFTVTGDGSHVIVVSDADGNSVTFNITILHQHNYVDGFCSCGKEDPSMFSTPGLYTASGKKLASWLELTEDYGVDVSSMMTSSNNVGTVCESAAVNPNGTNYVLVLNPSVTAIGDNAFYGSTKLKRVVGLENVTSIGSSAFNGCTSITGASLSPNLSVMKTACFANSGVKSIDIPNSVTSIPASAFSKCSNLSAVTISDSVTDIGANAFSSCSGLTNIAIPDSVTNIGSSAFTNCSGLTDIVIPDSVASIGSGIFFKCAKLSSVTLSNQLTDIPANAFEGSGIAAIDIPVTCTSIGNSAFASCKSLTQIDIPENVTSIGSGAFASCSKLTDVTMTDSVTTLGAGTSTSNGVFSGCSTLKNVKLSNNIEVIPAYTFCNIGSYSNKMTINIPTSLKSIGNNAFYSAYIANDLTFPESLTSLGTSAFENARTGKIISLGSITSIPTRCFAGGSKSFAKTAIPDTCTYLADECFSDSGSVYGLFIPASVTRVGKIFYKKDYNPYGSFLASPIYCEASSKPSGWNSEWFRIWSYKKLDVTSGSSNMIYYDHEPNWGRTR